MDIQHDSWIRLSVNFLTKVLKNRSCLHQRQRDIVFSFTLHRYAVTKIEENNYNKWFKDQLSSG